MNRTVVRKLVFIEGRGVAVAYRNAMARKQQPQTAPWYEPIAALWRWCWAGRIVAP